MAAVWLLNPHGVLFGHGARVDVGSLVTSTLRLNDVDWLNGRFNFAAAGADAPAGIVNRGELRSSLGGHIALLGGSVSNEHLIEAPGGQVLLAAGRSIDLIDTGSPHLRLRVTAPADAALNLGTLAAAGGRIDVHGAVVNQQGVVRADSLGRNAAGEVVLQASTSLETGAGSVTSASGDSGGRLTLDAGRDGTASVRGELLATGDSGAGGSLTLLGRRIGLTDAARLDASGAAGGSIHIGGGERGRDPALTECAGVVRRIRRHRVGRCERRWQRRTHRAVERRRHPGLRPLQRARRAGLAVTVASSRPQAAGSTSARPASTRRRRPAAPAAGCSIRATSTSAAKPSTAPRSPAVTRCASNRPPTARRCRRRRSRRCWPAAAA